VEIPVRLDFEMPPTSTRRCCGWTERRRRSSTASASILLRELVRIRVSQLNGCAYCIDMHTKDARALGESEQRIYSLGAWAEAPFYSDRERAALAFAETVTLVARDHVPAEAYEAVGEEFDEDGIAALIGLIVTINAWNAIAVSTRAWVPGSYRPA
jgi:AhpD family alkylhydroperoxidase